MERSKVYLTREQSRLADHLAIEGGTSGITLMDNAAKGCVRALNDRDAKSAVICCGIGNNGGDGFVIARRLAVQGMPVKTILCGDEEQIRGDARTNFKIAESLDLQIVKFQDDWSDEELRVRLSRIDGEPVDWIIDCLLGTGARGNPRSPMDRIISIANSIDANRFAVDVPSGLDCETGQPGDPTFKADVTCTFVARKTGFRAESAKPFLGDIRLVAIGICDEIVKQVLSCAQDGRNN